MSTSRESLVLTALAVGMLGLAMAWSVASARAQEPPSIAITAPTDGEVLPGPDLTVQVAVSGFDLRPPLQETREPNAGHIEYFLDVSPTFDQPTPLGEPSIIHSGRFSETFAGVPPGEHTVSVCLAYDDHTCIDPSLTDSARVTVGQPSPTPSPRSSRLPRSEPRTRTRAARTHTRATRTHTAAGHADPNGRARVGRHDRRNAIADRHSQIEPDAATDVTGARAHVYACGRSGPLAPSQTAATPAAWIGLLALACVSVVGLVAMAWLTLMGVRWPIVKR